MTSEFQAGWLQGADEIAPRAAAPENTTLALHQMLQLGARGVVNFPVQDTLYPSGYEAPWANWFYAWDAAMTLQGSSAPRWAPTAQFGELVRRSGSELAALAPKTDVAIAWLGSAYDPSLMTNDRFGALAAATIAQQQRCRALALTCRFVDLHFASTDDLRGYRALVIPNVFASMQFEPLTASRIAALKKHVAMGPTIDSVRRNISSSTGGLRDATLLVSPDGSSGILDVFNAGDSARHTPRTTLVLNRKPFVVPSMTIEPGGARDIPLNIGSVSSLSTVSFTPNDVPVTAAAFVPNATGFAPVAAGQTRAYADDVYRDGSHTFVLDNGLVRVVVSADSGGRAFIFEDLKTNRNLFTTIGGLRDDVASPPPASDRDYIARYTHPLPAGTFNRSYRCAAGKDGESATVLCTYDAPDLAPQPVHFEKEFILAPNVTEFRYGRERMRMPHRFRRCYRSRRAPSRTISSLSATLAVKRSGSRSQHKDPRPPARIRAAHPSGADTGKWRNGRRSRLKSGRGNSCGFESHLPHVQTRRRCP